MLTMESIFHFETQPSEPITIRTRVSAPYHYPEAIPREPKLLLGAPTCSEPTQVKNNLPEYGKDQGMQIIVGLVILIGLCWPAIKYILGLPYGFLILALAVLIWRACLR